MSLAASRQKRNVPTTLVSRTAFTVDSGVDETVGIVGQGPHGAVGARSLREGSLVGEAHADAELVFDGLLYGHHKRDQAQGIQEPLASEEGRLTIHGRRKGRAAELADLSYGLDDQGHEFGFHW